MNAIEFDVTDTLDKYNKLASSMPFIISKAQNSLAFERGRKSLSKHLNSRLDIKAKAMTKVNAIKVIKSDKKNLTTILKFHLGAMNKTNPLNASMELQQKGGTEQSSGGKLAIPHRGNMARYGKFPRSKALTKKSPMSINKVLDKVNSKKKINKHHVFVKSNGVYLGVGKESKLLYSFVEKARHNKKLIDFQKAVEIVYNKNFDRYFQREYLRLLKKV